jgi:hypothetical protein
MPNPGNQGVSTDPEQIQADMCLILKQEKHILLVLNELCKQVSCPPPSYQRQAEPEIDLLSIA